MMDILPDPPTEEFKQMRFPDRGIDIELDPSVKDLKPGGSADKPHMAEYRW